MVHLTMAHMDDSLEKEYGDNIEFNVSYWKKDNGGYPEVSCFLHKQTNKEINHVNSYSLFL